MGNATCKQRRTTLEYPTGRMISANTSSRSISKSPTSFIWKQSGDVLRARAQVPSRACCGQKKASENQQKQPRRSQMLASVAHQCLQRIRSPQNAALEICANVCNLLTRLFSVSRIPRRKVRKKRKSPRLSSRMRFAASCSQNGEISKKW